MFLALAHMLDATQDAGLGWGDVNVPCTCTMFLASQQDVFGQSTGCFWPVNRGQSPAWSVKWVFLASHPDVRGQLDNLLLVYAFTMTLINYVFLRQCKG